MNPAAPALPDGWDTISVESRLEGARADAMWERVCSPAGINDELLPLLRMTMPRRYRGSRLDQVPVGERLGRSWILLFGVLPIDYDDVVLAEVDPGRRFLERSRTATTRVWQHERIIEPDRDAVVVRDRVSFCVRAPLRVLRARRVYRRAIQAIFDRRHRRLRRRFPTTPRSLP